MNEQFHIFDSDGISGVDGLSTSQPSNHNHLNNSNAQGIHNDTLDRGNGETSRAINENGEASLARLVNTIYVIIMLKIKSCSNKFSPQ